MTWKLFLQASSWSYLSCKANGMVVRRLDQILRAETQTNDDFWKFMLTEHSSHDHLKPICENPGQRWVTVNIFCFDREYLLNYRRYGKTVNKFFVATSMYFSKMQKFLDFEVFKGVKRYDEKNCYFERNRQFSHILLRSPNEVDLLLTFLFLKGLWCV